MEETRRNKVWKILLKAGWVAAPAFLFVYLFLITLNLSLNDPDLFWHIRTGEFIFQNWEVPEVDPFAYTTPRPLSMAQTIGLRAQWLGQVMFAGAYLLGGLKGVLLFRNVLIALPSLIIFLWMWRKGMGLFTSLTVSALPGLMYAIQLFYSFERPQGISFSLIVLAFIVLDELREAARRKGFSHYYWMLPVMTALWSNLHAGFIVGNAVIGLYMTGEIIRHVYHIARKTEAPPVVRPVFYAVCAMAVLATMLNPNTYHLFYSYASGMVALFFQNTARAFTGESGSWVQDVVLEYKPLIYFYRELNYKWLIFYWTFTAVLYAVIFLKYWFRRSVDVAEFLALSLIVFFANYHARGLMFSLSVISYVMARSLWELGKIKRSREIVHKAVLAALVLLTVGFYTYSYKLTPFLLNPRFSVVQNVISPWYPTHMMTFLKEVRPKPPMYNYYTWGGFLIWALYPDYQVYIDGRAIDDMVTQTADDILKLNPGWDSKLEAYGINFVVIPLIFRESGHVIPLAPALAQDSRWKLIYLKNNGAVFVRDVPQNQHLVERFNVEKKYVFYEILNVENILLSAVPNNPIYNIAKADALFYLGEYDAAKAILDRFAYRAEVQVRLKEIAAMQYRKK